MIPIDYVIVTRRSATVPFVIIIIVWFNYRIGWQFPAITPISLLFPFPFLCPFRSFYKRIHGNIIRIPILGWIYGSQGRFQSA